MSTCINRPWTGPLLMVTAALLTQPAWADAAADADLQKKQADARKAEAEAVQAEIAAQNVQLRAGSGIAGTATPAEGAGSTEAMLLGAKALDRVAGQLADSLRKQAESVKKAVPVVVLAPADKLPDFVVLDAYQARLSSTGQAVRVLTDKAEEQCAAPTGPAPGDARTSALLSGLGGATLAIDGIGRLLSFAKTDYTFQNLPVEGNQLMLVQALASKMAALSGGPVTTKVQVPALYAPVNEEASRQTVTELAQIDQWLTRANGARAQCEKKQIELAVAIKKDDKNATLQLQKAELDALHARLKQLTDSLDAWSKALNAEGQMTVVTQQRALRKMLNDGALLVIVQLHKLGGTSYTKKNLWSSLGKNPFYVMGGALAGYTAFDGKTGALLGSALIPWHGGYHSVSDIQAEVNPR